MDSKTAWVEIHGAVLHCPCGHETDYTDHVRSVFASKAAHACAGCGKSWGTPAAADCEQPEAGDGWTSTPQQDEDDTARQDAAEERDSYEGEGQP